MRDKTDQSPPVADEVPPRLGKRSGFRTLVGYHTQAWRANYAEIALDLGPEHGNSIGMTHGGVLMTILDAAMGHAATYTPVEGNVRACVTLSMTTSFLVAPRGGRITAIARLVSVANRVGVCEGEVRGEDGTLLCVAQASFRYLAGSEHGEGVPKTLSG